VIKGTTTRVPTYFSRATVRSRPNDYTTVIYNKGDYNEEQCTCHYCHKKGQVKRDFKRLKADNAKYKSSSNGNSDTTVVALSTLTTAQDTKLPTFDEQVQVNTRATSEEKNVYTR
jgi:hypothetical protein